MIVTRTPLRVSFCGGGSDLPPFYEKHGGCVISTSIDKYIYISITRSFHPDVSLLKYSKVEKVSDIKNIEHPIIRECLLSQNLESIELSVLADVPAGTGLGSSGSFSVGLVNALAAYRGHAAGKEELAKDACDVEIVRLKQPIGKQDQYAAAYGGLNYFEFKKDGSVSVERLNLLPEKMKEMNDNLMLFFTGTTRNASDILEKQMRNTDRGTGESNQLEMCRLTEELKRKLCAGKIDHLGDILDKGWKLKRTLADGISNGSIDRSYDIAMKNGASGGKLLGAGGGGFLLFYVDKEHQESVKNALRDLRHMPFRFDDTGSCVAYNDKIIG